VFVAGIFDETVDFGGGPLVSQGAGDFFVAKFDCSGAHIWSKRFGASTLPYWNFVWALAVGNDGSIVLTGTFQGPTDFGTGPLKQVGNGDGFVVKLDAAGNPVFAKSFGGTGQYSAGTGVAVDGMGNVFLAGDAFGPQNFGGGVIGSAGVWNYFVVEFDSIGNHVWSKAFGQGDVWDASATKIVLDPCGDILLAGSPTVQQLNFGGGMLAPGAVFTAKLTSNGGYVWAKAFGSGGATLVGLAVGPNGELVFSGRFSGMLDFGGGALPSYGSPGSGFLVKLTNAGSFVFNKANTSAMAMVSSFGYGVAVNSSGEVYWTGDFSGTIDIGSGPTLATGLSNVLFAKFAPTGTLSWFKTYASTGYDSAYAVALDASATPFIVGSYQNTMDLGNGPLPIAPNGNGGGAYLARVAP
jgi:hypothetical protein